MCKFSYLFLKKNLAFIPREHVATDLYQSLYDISLENYFHAFFFFEEQLLPCLTEPMFKEGRQLPSLGDPLQPAV